MRRSTALLPILLLAGSLDLFAEEMYDYQADIAPILDKYCVQCHGPDKQKSGFRLDSYAALMTPGDSDDTPIEPGYPMESPLVEYLLLPKSDDYAMPPEDEATPTGEEILKIVHWIYEGAKSASDIKANLPVETLLGEEIFSAVTRLREAGAIIHKQGENVAGIVVDLQHSGASLSGSHLEDLKSIATFVRELRATRLEGSAAKLDWLAGFDQLSHLDLSHGKIGDDAIAALNRIESIEHLNFFGTELTDKGLNALKVPHTGKLFIGQTRVRARSIPGIQSANPNRAIYGLPNLNATLDITEEARSNSSGFNPIPDIEPGIQKSSTGIRHSFLVCGRFTAVFDENSEVAWLGPRGARDGMVLKNGNILLSVKNEAREYKKGTYEIIWSYALDSRNKELGTVFRLPTGNTLVVERGVHPRLLEVDHQGAIVVEVPLLPETDNNHMQTRMARKLPNGNYLVPHLLAFKVKEYTPAGEVVNVIRTDLESLGGREAKNWPFTAIRLPNGNTVVNLTHGNKTVEFAPDGSIAWRCDNSDVNDRFQDPCGGQRLPSGNTVIGCYAQRDPEKTKIFEVDRNKKVVWEFFHPDVKAHQVHILTTNGEPVSPIYR